MPLRAVSRKGESAHLVAGFIHDADLPLAVAPELAAQAADDIPMSVSGQTLPSGVPRSASAFAD
jgi:hypothetical protein